MKTIQVRDTDEYTACMDDIGDIIEKYKLTIIEAIGILEAVKSEIISSTYESEEEDD